MPKFKSTKYSAVLVIYNNKRTKYLIVKRPLDDSSLPGYWGFPAGSKKCSKELWEDTVHRIAKIKLGVEVKIVKLIGSDEIDRKDFMLKLRDYEVKVIDGQISVPQNNQGVTQYIESKYTNNPSELIKSARCGSLCSRVFLKANNINWS